MSGLAHSVLLPTGLIVLLPGQVRIDDPLGDSCNENYEAHDGELSQHSEIPIYCDKPL